MRGTIQLMRSWGGVLLLLAGLGVGEAEAQRHYVSLSGTTPPAGVLGAGDCNNPSNPCNLQDVLAVDNAGNSKLSDGRTLAILVSRVGGTVEITFDVTVKDSLNFALYTGDGAPTSNEAGTLTISGNTLTIDEGGVIAGLGDLTRIIETAVLNIDGNADGGIFPNTWSKPPLPGSVTIGRSGSILQLNHTGSANPVIFNDLTIAGGTEINASILVENVVVSSGEMVAMKRSVTQTEGATLKLERGMISTGDSAWVVTNPGIEMDIANRTSVPMTEGNVATIFDGSRASFVSGTARRTIAHGTSGGGNAKGGYLFPTGMAATDADRRARYRPLIIQFPADLAPVITADVATYSGDVMWPAEGVDASGATLDTYASAMWLVNLSAIPAQKPIIRVMAEGLTGVNDATKLHVVQWDCDGTNPRVTGRISGSGLDDSLLDGNGRISNMFIVTSTGVALGECTILGIAAKHSENPIGDGPPAATPMANMQLIHNIFGVRVDVYVDEVKLVDDFGFQQATSLSTAIAAGQHQVHVVPATAADNSNPIATIPVELAARANYTLIANGDQTNFDFAVLANTRSEALTDDMVEFRVVHGAASLGEVDIHSLTETGRWANNLDFNEATGYRTAEATVHNVELLNGNTQVDVFEFDLGDYINQTLVLALSGLGTSSATGLTIIGVTTSGDIFTPQVVTSAQSEELPTGFALQGNYPNPFNPSTQIQFDLPSTADVTIQVIDLLGRMVLELPAQTMEAGANQTLELDGYSLASGSYLYRMIANMESGVQVRIGHMVLIK